MTVAMATTRVSASMVLAIVDEARAKNYGSGVIGIRGVPDRAITADLQHQGQTVRVRAAESPTVTTPTSAPVSSPTSSGSACAALTHGRQCGLDSLPPGSTLP